MPNLPLPKLFVYGTLRTPAGGPAGDTHYHRRIADEIVSARMATLPDAQLYDFGPYPGVGRDRAERTGDGTVEHSVRGEVFEITEAALAAADVVEGHPDFYERRLELIVLDDGTSEQAWVYWAPTTLLRSATVIESGDWFERARNESTDSSDSPESIDEHLASAKDALKHPDAHDQVGN